MRFGTTPSFLKADVASPSCTYNVSVSGSTALNTGASNSYVVTVSGSNCTAATTATLAYSYPSATPTPFPQCSFEGSGSVIVPVTGSITNNLVCSASTSVAAGSYPYTIQVTSMTGTGSALLNLSVTASTPVCNVLTLTLDKTSYAKGDMVNYTYACTPAGSKAANTAVQVVKPDGTATTYNSGTNIDTASLGFSTSNLAAGTYTLRACLSAACTTGVTAVPFTIVDTAVPTPAPSSCAVGAKCPSGSWCSNGQSFYYPTGEVTCAAWSNDGAQPVAPAGTSECRPSDTNCVATGLTVPYVSGKYCSRGMSYYSKDGKMTCVLMSPGVASSAPAGYSSCRPDDASCIAPGAYGSATGWCSMGMKFYQKIKDANSNNDVYCAEQSTSMTSGTTWVMPDPPAGYSSCDPMSTSCKEKGDTWTDTNSSYWCTNATKCTLPGGGGSCVGMNESCPTGSKLCSAGSGDGCIEPGEYKTYATSTTSTNSSYWCGGGGGMTFYSATQAYCAPRTSSGSASLPAMMMWTSADVKGVLQKLGSGWGLCSPKNMSTSGKCLEPGQTGSSSDWCGWWPPNSMGGNMTGTTGRTCPALDDTTPVATPVTTLPVKQTPVVPQPALPIMLVQPMVTPPVVPVDVPMPPLFPNSNQCRMVRDEIRPVKYEIRKVEQNLKYLPKGTEVPEALKTALMKASVVYDELDKKVSQLSGKTCSSAEYQALRTQANDLYTRMTTLRSESQNIEMYQRVVMMEKDLKDRISGLEKDQKRRDGRMNLANEIGSMKSLLVKITEARLNISTLDRYAVEDIEFERQDIESSLADKFASFQDESRTSFVVGKITSIRDGITAARAQMMTKKIDGSEQCVKVSTLFGQVEDILAQADASYAAGDRDAASELLQKVDRFESLVRESAKQCGISFEVRGVRDAAVETLAQKISDATVSKTLAVLNEKIQKLSDQLSELTAASSNLKTLVEQSLTAMNAIPKNQREATQSAKEALIGTAKVTESLKGLTPAVAARLRAAIEGAAGRNFCGSVAADVQKATESLKNKAENNDLLASDVNGFEEYVTSATQRNGDECYNVGASQFRDMDTAAWYFPYFQNGTFFKGGTDSQGRPTGAVEPARQTLRAEALIAIERAFGITGVDGSCELTTAPTSASVTGVPDWARCAVNKAIENHVTFYGPMNVVASRDEVASWIVAFGANRFPVGGATSYTREFSDIGSCRAVDSVNTLVANKIMTGFTGARVGTWGCGKPLLRSDLAAILARLAELMSLTTTTVAQ